MGQPRDDDWRSDVSGRRDRSFAEQVGLVVESQVSRWGARGSFEVPRFRDAVTTLRRRHRRSPFGGGGTATGEIANTFNIEARPATAARSPSKTWVPTRTDRSAPTFPPQVDGETTARLILE